MLNKKVEDLLNKQIEKEEYSSNLYLSMAIWAETSGYAGISQWLYEQSEEEREHMLKFIKYVNDRGGKAIVGAVEQPPVEFDNIKKVFVEVLEHERFISQSINEIVELCVAEKDFTTQNWLQFFVMEQIEEEASVQLIIDKLNLLGDHNLYLFDRDIMTLRA